MTRLEAQTVQGEDFVKVEERGCCWESDEQLPGKRDSKVSHRYNGWEAEENTGDLGAKLSVHSAMRDEPGNACSVFWGLARAWAFLQGLWEARERPREVHAAEE